MYYKINKHGFKKKSQKIVFFIDRQTCLLKEFKCLKINASGWLHGKIQYIVSTRFIQTEWAVC